MERDLFGFPPEHDRGEADVASDLRFNAPLDLLEVLAELETDESAHPWQRAGILAAAGHHSEAARDYLRASKRFATESMEGSGITGDERDWAQTALARAAEQFAMSGRLLTAAYLASTLPPEDRMRTNALIESRLD